MSKYKLKRDYFVSGSGDKTKQISISYCVLMYIIKLNMDDSKVHFMLKVVSGPARCDNEANYLIYSQTGVDMDSFVAK